MIPRAFRWKAEGSVPSTKVTSYDAAIAEEPANDERTVETASRRSENEPAKP
jgi:hypothetical protein